MPYIYTWRSIFDPGRAGDFFENKPSLAFAPEKVEFCPVNAWWLSEFCRLIYVRGRKEAPASVQTAMRNRFLHPIGLDERWYYNGRYVQCSLIGPSTDAGNDYNVLVFRGTRRGFSNWSFLLNMPLAPWPAGGKVHRGFKGVMEAAWHDIEPRLSNLTSPLFYSGHSLGGSLAVLAATLKAPDAVYTFGAPRMVDGSFVKASEHLAIFRVANPRDIVVSVPPIPGVLHVGQAHYLEDMTGHEHKRSWRDAPLFLAAHSPSNYSLQMIRIQRPFH